MKNKGWIFLCFLLLPAAGVFAQQQILTLPQAIDLSLKNSNQLKSSLAQIEAATAALQVAKNRKLPEAGISGSYLRLNKPNVDLKIKQNQGGGGTPAESPQPSQAMYAMGNVSLPLFSGFSIKYGIQSAQYLQRAAELDADNDRSAIVFNTIDAYNNLYKARAAVDLFRENLQSAKTREKQLSNLEQNGLLARNDLLKAQLQVSNTELALLDAESNWQLANANMAIMLGLPEDTMLNIDTAALKLLPQVQPLQTYINTALQNRSDLQSLDFRKQAASAATKATEGEKYPALALTGGYVALKVPEVLTVTNAVNIGLGVQYSIASLWKNKAKVSEAKAREKQAAAGEALLADAIRLQVHQAYQNYLVSVKKIAVYQTAIEQASENYRIINNKYRNSLATTTELLEADVSQLQASMNFAFAQSDAFVAYQKLLQTAGALLSSQNHQNQ